MRHSQTSQHLPTLKAADMEQIIKQPKEERVHVETIPKLEHFTSVDLPDICNRDIPLHNLPLAEEKETHQHTFKWIPPVMNIISARGELQCWTAKEGESHKIWCPTSCGDSDQVLFLYIFFCSSVHNFVFGTKYRFRYRTMCFHC